MPYTSSKLEETRNDDKAVWRNGNKLSMDAGKINKKGTSVFNKIDYEQFRNWRKQKKNN